MIWMKNERVILGQSLAKSVDFGERENEMGVLEKMMMCQLLIG